MTLKRSCGSNSSPALNQVKVGSSPAVTFLSCPFSSANTSLASLTLTWQEHSSLPTVLEATAVYWPASASPTLWMVIS